jgi:hypothetical protein
MTLPESGRPALSRRKTLISVFILVVIGLHAVPVLLDRGREQITWPFLVWSMYKKARPPGPIKGWKTHVAAITASGDSHRVNPELVGLSGSATAELYLQPWMKGDSSAPRRLLLRLNRDRQTPFVQLRLARETYLVSDTGLVRDDPPVLTYRLPHTDAGER